MPGTGKSMAMKHMVKNVERLSTTNAVVASFFFHAQGTELQKSLLGLYRALLHQLYPHFLHIFSDLTDRFKEYMAKSSNGGHDWSWMAGEIRKYFLRGILNACRERSIVLVIDAVDEAGDSSAKEVIRDLQQLLSSLSDPSCQLRICLSCRHYPEIILQSGKTLVMEMSNYQDMATVVSKRIDGLHIFNDLEKQQIKAEVLRKSGGIFQWTSLAVDRIVHERTRGISFQAALETMERVPMGLDFLYKALLEPGEQQCSLNEEKQRRALFYWVLFATRPLSPQELQHALALSQDMTYTSIYEYEKSSGFILVDDYDTRIMTLSKGLIRKNGSSTLGELEFIHQSVVDFLLNRGGLGLLSNATEIEPVRLAHFEISRTCLKYLFMTEIKNMLRELPRELMDHELHLGDTDNSERSYVDKRMNMERMFPFISYAWEHWIFHAVSAESQDGEATKFNNADILETFGWPNDELVIDRWKPLRRLLGCPLKSWQDAFLGHASFAVFPHSLPYTEQIMNCDWSWDILDCNYEHVAEWPIDGSRLTHLFALCGLLHGTVQERVISEVASLESSTARTPTPLIYALVGQQKQTVRSLLAAGVHPQSDGRGYYQSPIHLASVLGDVEVISLLINSGSSLASSHAKRYSPLHLAAAFGHRAAAQILVGAGARIDSKGPHGFTPLFHACLYGHCEVTKKLLELGANPKKKAIQQVTPLLLAVYAKRPQIVELLLQNGAIEDARLLSSAAYSGSQDTVKAILDHGTNAKAKRRSLDRALFTSVETKNLEIARLLIASGANVNAMLAMPRVPLHITADWNAVEFTALLLQHGADPNIKDLHGETPLMLTMSRANNEIGRLLLEAGADPNMKDDDGRTALMNAGTAWGAAGNAHWRVEDKVDNVRLLLQYGADATARSLDGVIAHSFPENGVIDDLLRAEGSTLYPAGGSEAFRVLASSYKRWARMNRHKFRQTMINIGLKRGVD